MLTSADKACKQFGPRVGPAFLLLFLLFLFVGGGGGFNLTYTVEQSCGIPLSIFTSKIERIDDGKNAYYQACK